MSNTTVVSSGRSGLASYLNPLHLLANVWTRRDLIGQLIWRGVQSRYRGSSLGLVWAFILPFLMLSVYTFAFSVVLRGGKGAAPGVDTPVQFALWLFCGLIPFQLFAECLTQSPLLVVSNPSYVKKVVFPLEVLPVVLLGTAAVNGLIGLGILLTAVLISSQGLSPYIWALPLAALPLGMFSLGVGWLLASLGVYLRDIGQLATILSQMLMFITPIFYSLAMVPSELAQNILRINPLTAVVENARRMIIPAPEQVAPDWGWLAVMIVVSAVVMQLGYAFFMKTKRGFADVL